MKETIFEELLNTIADDMLSNGYILENGASQFRGTEKYNDWFSKLSDCLVESEDDEVISIDEADDESIAEYELFLEDIMESCEDCKCKKVDPETGEETEVIDEGRRITNRKSLYNKELRSASAMNLRKRKGLTAGGRRRVRDGKIVTISGKELSAIKRNSKRAHASDHRDYSKRINRGARKLNHGQVLQHIEESELDGVIVISFPVEDIKAVKDACKELSLDCDFEEGNALVAGLSEELCELLEKLKIQSRVEDLLVVDEPEEVVEESEEVSEEVVEESTEEVSEEQTEDGSEEVVEESEEVSEEVVEESSKKEEADEVETEELTSDDEEEKSEEDSEEVSDSDDEDTDEEKSEEDSEEESDDEESDEEAEEDEDEESDEEAEDLDEAHMTPKAKRLQKKARKKREQKHLGEFSPKGIRKQELKAEGKLKIDKSLSKSHKKAAKTARRIMEDAQIEAILDSAKFRAEAILESIESQFATSNLFNSLNESESSELKQIFTSALSKVLDESHEKIAMDVIDECENYVSNELMPEMIQIFSEEYTQEILSALNENVDEYIEYAANQIVEELDGKNLIVKSTKTAQLEEFSEAVLSLIQDKLQIIPEQEDALLKAQEKISELTDQIQESSIEQKKLNKKLMESKKEAYIYKNMPSDISEAQKENLMGYVETVLSEAESMSEFMAGFDKAVAEIEEINTPAVNESIAQPVAPEKEDVSPYAFLFDAVSRLGK